MLKGIEYLRTKLANKRPRVNLRYKYYEMKAIKVDPSPAIPPALKEAYAGVLGWCGHAVDALADRLCFEGFEDDAFKFDEIFAMNNPDILFDSAFLGALVSSCDFVYIRQGSGEMPVLQVVDGANATGIISPITGLLTEGYAVLERDDYDNPVIEAYFTPEFTEFYYSADGTIVRVANPTGIPLLVPITYLPDAKRPFGRSRISRTCMSLQDKACQTITRADITAEFYSFPQKYVLGLSEDAEPMDTWRATMSAMLQFSKDEDGQHPQVGQFTAASMAPHLEQFKLYAAAFAGETGLTLDDLGFPTDNPTSADAIKASHETLRLKARKAQKTLGSGIINVGYVAACLRDKKQYERKAFYQTKPIWSPIFEADGSSLSGIGDAIFKLKQSFPDYIDEKKVRKLTGI